jgi:cystinosin
MTPAAVASSVVGWTYFTAWTVSFYPQAIMNYRRKSVDGLAVEFLYLNVGAFLCLSIYNIALYTSAGVRNEYAGRHDGAMPAVAVNDVAFAVHVSKCGLELSRLTSFRPS